MAASRPRTSRYRYWIATTLSALALASPLVIAATPAAAQGIAFSAVSGDGSGDLHITVASDYPMNDWTLSLSNGTSTYTLDDFTDFTDESAPFTAGAPQIYVLTNAQNDLGSAGIALPPGSYTVTATAATATDGTSTETLASPQSMTGTFSFLAQPTLVLSSPSFNTSQPNQTVSIAGQITGCATLACPSSWSGTPVTVTDVTAAGKPQWTGTMDSAGNFSVQGVTGVPGDNYSASVGATATTLAATAPSNTVDVPLYAPTSITATAAPAPYGAQSITGQLTYQPPSGFSQGAPSGVPITATSGSHKFSTTTGPGGAFRLALPGITGTTNWVLTTEDDLTTTPFLAATQNSVGATQLWPTRITGFTASIDKFGYVSVAGCMSTTISPPPPPEYPEVQIQWRARRSGPWHELGTLPTMHRIGCAGVGFLGKGPAQAASAYYRAYFPAGDSTYASAASASTARVWIYPTRFNPFRASSRSVVAGRRVTISGTLQYDGGKWRGYGHQHIVIIFSRNGQNNWFRLPGGLAKTNSNGKFSVTFSDTYRSEFWSANFAGNKTHLVVSAPLIRIKVHGSPRSRPASSGQPPVGRLSAALSSGAGTGARLWPFALTTDPLLMLMGDY